LLAAGVVASFLVPATAAAASGPTYTPLTLQNGWTGSPFGTGAPAVRSASHVVTFKGALAGGTSADLFTLPPKDAPATDVYVPVDLYYSANGRLHIRPSGLVSVETEGAFVNAQGFISLDGVSFTQSEQGAKPLALVNGWTNAPFATSNAAVRVVGGVVRLQGAIANGTENTFATLPKADWPKAPVIVPLDLCDASHGMLQVGVNGTLEVFGTVQFADAACFTSLDGATWLKADAPSSQKVVVLQNGWGNYAADRPIGIHASGKVVRFEGAVSAGTSPVLFTLPAKDRPAADVYIATLTCTFSPGGGAGNARLVVNHTTGEVLVQTENGLFSDAQRCTFVDGSWFAQ
jgi:hypothetical protein